MSVDKCCSKSEKKKITKIKGENYPLKNKNKTEVNSNSIY